jgi:dephospho-CoA kinase
MNQLNLKSRFIKLSKENRLYQIPVPIIGLTGGIATGKSTVADFLRSKNIPVIDADKLVKRIYQKPETKSFIQNEFPDCFENGEIIFKKLREVLFNSLEDLKKVETHIYQYMPEEFKKDYSLFKSPSFIVYDVPLLFEKNLYPLVDLKVCVYCPRKMQLERILNRDQCSPEVAGQIIDRQLDIEVKKSKSDQIIENIAGKADLIPNIESFLDKVLE